MKRLLLPLIAALALPTAASAESAYLILRIKYGNGLRSAMQVVPMESMNQCELSGAAFVSSQRIGGTASRYYECILGK